MNEDSSELLDLLKSHAVEFLVVGAHAVSFHARPRMTEDLDLWIGRGLENAQRLRDALAKFGAPIGDEGAKRFSEFERQMIRLGAPPNMVDLLNFAGDAPFEEVYSRRVGGDFDGFEVFFPSRGDLIEMKRSAGRSQDLADIEALERYQT